MSYHLEHVPLYHMMFELAKELRNKAQAAHTTSGQLEWDEMKYAAGAIFFACASLESWANVLVNDRALPKCGDHATAVTQRLAALQSQVKRGRREGWDALSPKQKCELAPKKWTPC